MPKLLQFNQFNGGELNPLADKRSDLNNFFKFYKKGVNVLTSVFGGLFKAAGTKFLKEYIEPPFVMAFNGGIGNSYVLFFVNDKIEVYKAPFSEGKSAIAEISSPYLTSDLYLSSGVERLRGVQSGDTLYIVDKLGVYQEYQIRYLGIIEDAPRFEIAPIKYIYPIFNEYYTGNIPVLLKTSGTSGIVTLSSLEGNSFLYFYVPLQGKLAYRTSYTLVKYRITVTSTRNNIKTSHSKEYSAGSRKEADSSFMPLLKNVLKDEGWNNTILDGYKIYIYDGNDGDKIEIIFTNIFINTNTIVYDEIKIFSFSQASGAVFEQQMVGSFIRLWGFPEGIKAWQASISVVKDAVYYSDDKYYKATRSGTTGNIKITHSKGIRSDGNIDWEYLHAGNGYGEIIEYISPTEVRIQIDKYIPNMPVYDTFQFSLNGGSINPSPCDVGFFKDRKVLTINSLQGPLACFSQTGDYNNFNDRNVASITDDCAFNLPIIGADVNAIEWLYASEQLFIGTGSAIFEVSPITSSKPFAPGNATLVDLSFIGGCSLKPLSLAGDVMYVDNTTRIIRQIAASEATDKTICPDISTMSEHLLSKGIISSMFNPFPNRQALYVDAEGNVISYIYLKEQEVFAFQRLKFDKQCVAAEVLYDKENTVLFTFYENGKFFVESWDIVQDIFNEESWNYLDSSVFRQIQYNSEEKIYYIEGLSHLEGKKITVLVDNKEEYNNLEVFEGKAKIPIKKLPGNESILAGISKEMYIEMLPLSLSQGNETTMTMPSRVNKIIVDFFKGRKISLQINDGEWYEVDLCSPNTEDIFSGLFERTFPLGYKREGISIKIKDNSAFPFYIKAVFAEATFNVPED